MTQEPPTTREITLAIETSNPGATPEGAAEVGLGEVRRDASGAAVSAALLDAQPVRAVALRDDGLFTAIDVLCRRAGVRPADLARVAVSVGPGGFTSVRVAVAAAKCIAEATGAACVAAPSAEVALRGALAAGPVAFPAAVALASKRGGAWVAVFEAPAVDARTGLPRWAPGRPGAVIDAAWLDALRVEARLASLLADAHLPEPMRACAERAGLPILPCRFTARACFEASVHREPLDALALAPIYPREPEAVTKWREKKARS